MRGSSSVRGEKTRFSYFLAFYISCTLYIFFGLRTMMGDPVVINMCEKSSSVLSSFTSNVGKIDRLSVEKCSSNHLRVQCEQFFLSENAIYGWPYLKNGAAGKSFLVFESLGDKYGPTKFQLLNLTEFVITFFPKQELDDIFENPSKFW